MSDDGNAEPSPEPSPDGSPVNPINVLLPDYVEARVIKGHLDRFVVSQESAKTELSTLLSMHLLVAREPDRRLQPPNALMVGPTGVGKTHSIRIAAEYLKLPILIIDATKLLPSGAREEGGEHIEYVLAQLLEAAHEIVDKIERDARKEAAKTLRSEYGYADRGDLDDKGLLALALAERGIIFVDEFDKLTTGGADLNVAGWNRTVQRRLLKLVDGSDERVGSTMVDTSRILFVAAGAFAVIDGKGDRVGLSPGVSGASPGSDRLLSSDIVRYGFIPELIARFPIMISYGALTTLDLQQIMSDATIDPLQLFAYYFEKNGKRLVISDETRQAIAAQAHKLEMGVRGIHQVVFPQIAQISYSFFQQNDEDVYELTADAVHQYARGGDDGARTRPAVFAELPQIIGNLKNPNMKRPVNDES
jgi:ATP-dependent Clp protease ATP-binding subunit ClpX